MLSVWRGGSRGTFKFSVEVVCSAVMVFPLVGRTDMCCLDCREERTQKRKMKKEMRSAV